MSKLFDTLAGRAQNADYFNIGDVQFYADPFTLQEWAELRAIPDVVTLDGAGRELGRERDTDAWAEFMAGKLRRRVRGKTDPATVTAGWLLEHLPAHMMPILDYLFLNGKMPSESEKK